MFQPCFPLLDLTHTGDAGANVTYRATFSVRFPPCHWAHQHKGGASSVAFPTPKAVGNIPSYGVSLLSHFRAFCPIGACGRKEKKRGCDILYDCM